MIKNIYVNGFRTLSEFELKLSPGLNILVGPNGGGKTTIIMFFSFLNRLHSEELSNAISAMGGAGAIFRKIGKANYERIISAEIYGSIPIENGYSTRFPYESRYLEYKYKFEIQLSDDREDVHYKNQEIFLRLSEKETRNLNRVVNWDFKASRSIAENGKIRTDAKILNDTWQNITHPRFGRLEADQIPDSLISYLDESLGVGESLLNASRLFRMDVRILLEKNFGQGILYNPVPDLIRKPEDSAKHPGIRSDGSGLYASLLAIKRKKYKAERQKRPIESARYEVSFQRTSDVTLPNLVSYFKLAFSSLYSLDVTNDPFDNQIRARITLDSRDGIQLPLASLSDGTLKWMALVTALMTAKNIIAIEEPENFIHPAVQQHALALIRSQIQDDAFILVSSHSQSVLDAAKPEELIIVTLEQSKTLARRVKDPEKIKTLVYDSGFGLSFYYMSGAI